LIYVDDILITGSSSADISSIISILNKKNSLKDLGLLHYFFRIEIVWHRKTDIHLCHTKYIKQLLQKANMHEAKPQPTPMTFTIRLTQDVTTAFNDHTLCRSIIGALQYVTITHPELAYSINKVIQYMHQPQKHH